MTTREQLFPNLQKYFQRLEATYAGISAERKALLLPIRAYIEERKEARKIIQITVVCTHNSRRSHFGQLWLKAAAYYYGISNFYTFSGGVEATAFNPRAVAAMERAGFEVAFAETSANPLYTFSLGDSLPKERCYSKRFDAVDNPHGDFAAIMVCTDADENCPVIPGAEKRFSLPFIDPKVADDTLEEAEVYDLRCEQMARELAYVCAPHL